MQSCAALRADLGRKHACVLCRYSCLRKEQLVESRPVGEPIMAIVSLRDQQITVYDDAKGGIMRAPVSRAIATVHGSDTVKQGICP